MNNKFYNFDNFTELLFNKSVKLLKSVTELFELELSYLEYKCLPTSTFLERAAFFESCNGKYTKHYLLYSNSRKSVNEGRSALTKAYFEDGRFSTGYATHGLFPYRGKFHPQLIKGLINIIGIKKGETILDPMCGSGTTNVEAALMGINSFGIDISPFCQLMSKVKYDVLTIDIEYMKTIKLDYAKLYKYFSNNRSVLKIDELGGDRKKIYYFALLAFLDSLGYSRRVNKTSHLELYKKVLNRYINTITEFLNNPYFNKQYLGKFEILKSSDALNIKLEDSSIDGVITSPPYSFAIDYVENDKDQLEYLGYSIKELKSKMIGLKGNTKKEKLSNYFNDMNKFCSEVSRVLKKHKYFILIIGSNTNQTGGIRLEQNVINSSREYGLNLVKSVIKPIKGMWNTMKEEYILIFEKK